MAEHGGNIYKYKNIACDFSANINPFGINGQIKAAMQKAVEDCIHYPDPDCGKLRAALSQRHGVAKEEIVPGNGGADIIYRLVQVLRPQKALLPIPTFLEYEEALRQAGCKVAYYHLPMPSYQAGEDFVEQLQRGHFDFTVICNPNNPTGGLTPKALVQKILKSGVFVLADECFLDMTDVEAAYSLIGESSRNLLVLKSLTKMYAIPGVRIGYGISKDEELIKKIKDSTQAWPVSVIAQAAGCAAAADMQTPKRLRAFLRQEGCRFYQELMDLEGVFPLKPSADFIFFRSHPALWDGLVKQGFLIRDCSNYPGLGPGCYRTAVKTPQENQSLLNAIKKTLKQMKGRMSDA